MSSWFKSVLLLVLLVTWNSVQAQTRTANPFEGTVGYVNSDFSEKVLSTVLHNDYLRQELRTVASQPTAVWLDSIASIDGNEGKTLSLEEHLVAAELQSRSIGTVSFLGVIYNLPDRDCAAHASNGTLHGTAGLLRYKSDYIDRIVRILSDERFSKLHVILVIEPDSLANLITNQSVPGCSQAIASGIYEEGISYALTQFSSLRNVYSYLDIGHAGWLGWDNNRARAVQLYSNLIYASGSMDNIHGVATNVSGYTPLVEPLLPDPEFSIEGKPLKSAQFYEYNRMFGEKSFANALKSEFMAMGFPETFGVIIDTSRNGWGGMARPIVANWKSTVDEYVDAARLDRRISRGHWCNQAGAGLGERPQANPYADSVVHAFVWVKPPGESDGTSDATQSVPDEQGKSYDRSCSAAVMSMSNGNTGALPDAPAAGDWFPQQLEMLIMNAFPPLRPTSTR
jgi:cellulose 1,4-beta-cellobiosidase